MKKRRKALAIIIVIIFAFQIFPFNCIADSSVPKDLTGNTDYLVVHGTDYADSTQASSLKITDASATVISPGSDGSYSNIPAGAMIQLDYVFSLNDGNADNTISYNYDGDESFTAALPSGLNFAATTGTIVATDVTDGNYDLATWVISGSTLTVSLTDDTEDTTLKGGAADNDHLAKWGKVHIEGTFKALSAGDATDTTITFGTQTIIIRRQPLPMDSTLAKSGSYDASTNSITWTVKVTPPSGAPGMAYDGYSVIDEYDSNQSYVAGSLTVGGISLLDTDTSLSIDTANRKITYTFPDTDPDTTGEQTITYKTAPTSFSAENGSSAEYSTYNNKVNLKRGVDSAADEATASVSLDWISKTGEMKATTDDPTVVKWTVSVTVPGETGKSISGAVITDTIPSDLELFTDATHSVQIQLGSTVTDVTLGTTAGTYAYSGNILTYSFDSQPTAGTTAKLTFYTHVTAASWSTYLKSNNSISFSNAASMSWAENFSGTVPSDTYTVPNGIGSGGLLSKSAAGGTPDYTYSATDPGTIHWTITVNRNKISIVDANLTDIVPAGQKLLISGTNPFTVTRKGTTDTVIETVSSAASSTYFTYTDANHFSYDFPEEVATDIITSAYTVDYYTQILDTVPGTAGDTSGLDTLYKYGPTTTIGFGNGITLVGTGVNAVNVSTTGTKNYKSQMLDKTVATAYDYNTRTVQWKLVINRNRLPLTNASVTDTLPSGMTLLIDATHPFSIAAASGSDTGALTTGASGDTSFTYTLPTPTSDQFTVTYWTLMSEDTLKTQWSGTKDFTNSATLFAAEIATPGVTDTEKVSIKNPTISKSYTYANGDDTIYWSVVINPAQVLLTNASVTDVLNSSLKLDTASLKLYTVAVSSSDGSAVSSSKTLVDATTYTVTLPITSNSNTLTVALPVNTTSAYLLEFSTSVLTDSVNLTNDVSLTGSTGDPAGGSTSSQIVITDLYSSGGSGTNVLTVHKTDTSGNPLSGAVFQLLNVNKQAITKSGSIITKTTDTSGDAVFSSLPSWVFYVQEIEPPAGYKIASDPYSGGTKLSGTGTISVTDELALTSVSFDKKGANGALLSGGTFTLTGYDYKSDAVNKTASAVNGVVTFTDVAPNQTSTPYVITETAAPDGHALSADTLSATVAYNTAKDGLTVTVTPDTLIDTPLPADVSFSKTSTDGTPLSGGSFSLTGTDYASNAVSITGISAVSGTVTFPNVPIGSYTITETDSPSGYLMPSNKTILTATVAYNSASTGVVTTVCATTSGTPVVTSFSNTLALSDVSFRKISSVSGTLLSGGTFTLTGYDYKSDPVSKTASAVNGVVTFTDVAPNQTSTPYLITETAAPDGHALSANTLSATVAYNTSKDALTVTVTPDTLIDTPLPADVSFSKTSTDGTPLTGGSFSLTGTDYASNAVSITGISAVSGTVTFPNVPIGSYTITENDSPSGYLMPSNKTILTATVAYNGTNTGVVTTVRSTASGTPVVTEYSNTQAFGAVSFTKKSSNGGTLLTGGTFTLTGKDFAGNDVAITAASVAGTVSFTGIPLGDDYTVKEVIPPTGYQTTATELAVSIKYNADKTAVVSSIASDTLSNTPVPSGTYYGSAIVTKTDESGKALAGAVLTLYTFSGTVVSTTTTDASGKAYFSGITSGSYKIKETTAPSGYSLNENAITFTVYSSEPQSFTIVDKKLSTGSIKITKTDKAGTPLADAEFTLYTADGSAVKKTVSGTDGIALFGDLELGSYTIKETSAPKGYKLSDLVLAAQVSDSTPLAFTFYNEAETDPASSVSPSASPTEPALTPEPSPSAALYGTIRIYKVDTDSNPLNGAEFTLYDENGGVLEKTVSDADGIAVFSNLTAGKYSIKETAAPDGYVLNADAKEFEITAGQQLNIKLTDLKKGQKPAGVLGWSDIIDDTLPDTGGMAGSTLGLMLGLLLLLGGAVGILTGRKKVRGKYLRKKIRD